MVVDFDGRILAQADPGPGTKIVVAPIDVTALRHDREARSGHHMLSNLRTEAYPVYGGGRYPSGRWTGEESPDYAQNRAQIEESKGDL